MDAGGSAFVRFLLLLTNKNSLLLTVQLDSVLTLENKTVIQTSYPAP